MLKIAISGSTGRMGLALINAISKDKDFKLIGGVASESNSNIGKDLGEMAGEKRIDVKLSSKLSDLPKVDVLIISLKQNLVCNQLNTRKITIRLFF